MKTLKISRLFHIGTLNPESKKRNSYEGSGLSISNCPNAWRKIAKGYCTGDIYELRKTNGLFLDYHSLTEEEREMILNWGFEKGYILKSKIYSISWYDDGAKATYRMHALSLEEILDEEDEDHMIDIDDNGYVSSSSLLSKTYQSEKVQCYPMDLLTSLYVEEEMPCLDGIWWDDNYNVFAYSAPRGVILKGKIQEWEISKDSNFKTEFKKDNQDIVDNLDDLDEGW